MLAGPNSRDPLAVFKALLAVPSVTVHMVKVKFVMLVNFHDRYATSRHPHSGEVR